VRVGVGSAVLVEVGIGRVVVAVGRVVVAVGRDGPGVVQDTNRQITMRKKLFFIVAY
jgi:hypothetical protein